MGSHPQCCHGTWIEGIYASGDVGLDVFKSAKQRHRSYIRLLLVDTHCQSVPSSVPALLIAFSRLSSTCPAPHNSPETENWSPQEKETEAQSSGPLGLMPARGRWY